MELIYGNAGQIAATVRQGLCPVIETAVMTTLFAVCRGASPGPVGTDLICKMGTLHASRDKDTMCGQTKMNLTGANTTWAYSSNHFLPCFFVVVFLSQSQFLYLLPCFSYLSPFILFSHVASLRETACGCILGRTLEHTHIFGNYLKFNSCTSAKPYIRY